MRLPRNVEVMSGRSRDKDILVSRNMTGITNDVPKSYMIEVAAAFCLWQIVRTFYILFPLRLLYNCIPLFKDSFLAIFSFIEVQYIIFKTW